MMNCKKEEELSIYTTGGDFHWEEDDWDPTEEEEGGGGGQREHKNEYIAEERDRKAKQTLLNVIETIIPKEVLRLLSLETDPKKHPLLIIVDELGYMPHFLQALCSMGVEVLEKEVQERLGIKNPCSFIAGGTGAGDTNTMKQEAYQLCFMPNDETKVWDQLVEKSLHKENVSSAARALAGVLVKNERAKKLATNPRLAALMHNNIFGLKRNDFWSVLGNEPRPRALQSVLPEFFAQSVRKFRSLNAMASVDTKLLWKVYRSALAIVFFQELDRTCPTMLRQLVAGYGVVVDRAYVAKERNKHSSQGEWDPACVHPTTALHFVKSTSGAVPNGLWV